MWWATCSHLPGPHHITSCSLCCSGLWCFLSRRLISARFVYQIEGKPQAFRNRLPKAAHWFTCCLVKETIKQNVALWRSCWCWQWHNRALSTHTLHTNCNDLPLHSGHGEARTMRKTSHWASEPSLPSKLEQGRMPWPDTGRNHSRVHEDSPSSYFSLQSYKYLMEQ